MKNKKLTIFSMIVSAALTVTMLPICASATNDLPLLIAPNPNAGGDLVVFYTNDVHCGVSDNIGYTSLAALKQQEIDNGNQVLLVDAGDSIQGALIGVLSEGKYIVELMNQLGYDYAVPGNHEFDYGMDTFFERAAEAEYQYISSNFIDLETGETVFKPYAIEDFGDIQVAFVGICTPETFTKSTPVFFQNEDGEYIYSFGEGDGTELYNYVQTAIDDAKEEGADIVIGLAHLGIVPESEPFRSIDVIENTSGFDVMIDGHSHSIIENDTYTDLEGNEVSLTSTGTKLSNIGKMTIDLESGEIENIALIDSVEPISTEDESASAAFNAINDSIAKINAEFDETISQVVAESSVTLVVDDPESGERLVRNSETNLGDLCADAYREVLGADIGFMNGGGIRAAINAGEVTFGNIIDVNPFGNMLCVVEATGQEILDALELGAFAYPEESGKFLHVSGLTYEINASYPTSVVLDDFGAFVGVDGDYRVNNVMVGDEPLDLDKTYTLASHNYMLKQGGDGFNMFSDNTLLKDEVVIDNEALIQYIRDNLGGVIGDEYADYLGQGRIKISMTGEPISVDESGEIVEGSDEVIDEAEEITDEAVEEIANVDSTESVDTSSETAVIDKAESPNPPTGVENSATIVLTAIFAVSAIVFANKKLKK